MDNHHIASVSEWMTSHVAGFSGPVTKVQKFDVGQSNPTYRLSTRTADFVLRRKPPGVLLKSAHAVDREFRVQKALAGRVDFVCRMHALCMDETLIGSPFYVMDYVDGRSFVDPTMPGLTPSERGALTDEMNRVIAEIHEVDITSAGLSDFGPPGNYYERQLARWSKQYHASQTSVIPEMDQLMGLLDRHMPDDDGRRTLVHGDCRIDNMLFENDGSKCLAMLDWELSTIGHPFADLAAVIMQWQLPPGAEGRGLAGVDRATSGLPSDEAFVAQYCERRGLEQIDNFGFYVAFAFFRMAAILQGVGKRALDGTASSPEKARRLGQFVPRFAQLGLEAACS